jgi:hypothetical protein
MRIRAPLRTTFIQPNVKGLRPDELFAIVIRQPLVELQTLEQCMATRDPPPSPSANLSEDERRTIELVRRVAKQRSVCSAAPPEPWRSPPSRLPLPGPKSRTSGPTEGSDAQPSDGRFVAARAPLRLLAGSQSASRSTSATPRPERPSWRHSLGAGTGSGETQNNPTSVMAGGIGNELARRIPILIFNGVSAIRGPATRALAGSV